MRKLLTAIFAVLLIAACDTFNPPSSKKITVVKIDKEIFHENNMTVGDIFHETHDLELVASGTGEVIETTPLAFDWEPMDSRGRVWVAEGTEWTPYERSFMYFCGDEDSAQAIKDYYASIGLHPSNIDMGKVLREAKGN